MRLHRICRAPWRSLDGEGARLYGGRWTAPGRPVVYTSTALSLAALEYLIHVDVQDVPADLIALTIDLPDDERVDAVDITALSPGWEQHTEPPACRAAGDAWLRAAVSLALSVPSAPVPEERNVLIDARHPAAGRVRVVGERAFHFDPRLIG